MGFNFAEQRAEKVGKWPRSVKRGVGKSDAPVNADLVAGVTEANEGNKGACE
jgi:hypothetical protein